LDDYREDLMELRVFLAVIAVIMIVLISIVPGIVKLRIKIFRKLKWNSLANFHEKYFDQLVIIARFVLAFIVAILVFLILLG
jgi:hypothetical protein